MANLLVIYDRDKEIAAIINADEQLAWGPAMIGDGADEALQAFIEATPFDLTLMNTYDAKRAFMQFLGEPTDAEATPAGTPDVGSLVATGPDSMDAGTALAEREAVEHTDTPAPAPADTDMEAHASAPPQVRECPMCNGSGHVEIDGNGGRTQCGLCRGAGLVTAG